MGTEGDMSFPGFWKDIHGFQLYIGSWFCGFSGKNRASAKLSLVVNIEGLCKWEIRQRHVKSKL